LWGGGGGFGNRPHETMGTNMEHVLCTNQVTLIHKKNHAQPEGEKKNSCPRILNILFLPTLNSKRMMFRPFSMGDNPIVSEMSVCCQKSEICIWWVFEDL